MFEGDQPVRSACLAPDDGAVAAYLDADLSSAELMAVTVESAACPDAPTTDPVFTAELDTSIRSRAYAVPSASRRTIGRMPPWPKIATSAAWSIRTVTENESDDPSSRVTATVASCFGTIPASRPRIE